MRAINFQVRISKLREREQRLVERIKSIGVTRFSPETLTEYLGIARRTANTWIAELRDAGLVVYVPKEHRWKFTTEVN